MNDIDALVLIEQFTTLLPERKCSLHITHNQHRDYYQSVEDYLADRQAHPDEVLGRDVMVATDTVWELQVYPETPIGSYTIFGPTLASVILKARRT